MIPKPRLYDNVEKIDFSKCFGYVSKIISNTKVKVVWAKNDTTTENIKDLALVRRLK